MNELRAVAVDEWRRFGQCRVEGEKKIPGSRVTSIPIDTTRLLRRRRRRRIKREGERWKTRSDDVTNEYPCGIDRWPLLLPYRPPLLIDPYIHPLSLFLRPSAPAVLARGPTLLPSTPTSNEKERKRTSADWRQRRAQRRISICSNQTGCHDDRYRLLLLIQPIDLLPLSLFNPGAATSAVVWACAIDRFKTDSSQEPEKKEMKCFWKFPSSW